METGFAYGLGKIIAAQGARLEISFEVPCATETKPRENKVEKKLDHCVARSNAFMFLDVIITRKTL